MNKKTTFESPLPMPLAQKKPIRKEQCHSDQAKRVEESALLIEENGFFDSLSLAQNDTILMTLARLTLSVYFLAAS